jgi:hypothetical protein
MSPLAAFLQLLFDEGKVHLRERPRQHPAGRGEARRLLEAAYETARLDVAGPPLPFAAETALAAAEVVHQASWFLVSHAEPEEALVKALQMPAAPATAADHLSGDLVLRYLPQIYRRARAYAPSDRLTALLADLLRRWPLSGVLADIEEGPVAPPNFGGHAGLLLLYAERLAKNPRPAWVPEGQLLEYLEWVAPGRWAPKAAPALPPSARDDRE